MQRILLVLEEEIPASGEERIELSRQVSNLLVTLLPSEIILLKRRIFLEKNNEKCHQTEDYNILSGDVVL